MKKRTIIQTVFLAATLLLGSLAQPAFAGVKFHTDLASFQAASATSVAVTFEDSCKGGRFISITSDKSGRSPSRQE